MGEELRAEPARGLGAAVGQQLAEPTEDVRARTPAWLAARTLWSSSSSTKVRLPCADSAPRTPAIVPARVGGSMTSAGSGPGGECVRVDERHDPANGAVCRHPLDGLDRRPGRGVREHAAVDGEP